jgi:hypothetical protein
VAAHEICSYTKEVQLQGSGRGLYGGVDVAGADVACTSMAVVGGEGSAKVGGEGEDVADAPSKGVDMVVESNLKLESK